MPHPLQPTLQLDHAFGPLAPQPPQQPQVHQPPQQPQVHQPPQPPKPPYPPQAIDTPFLPPQGRKHDQGKLDWYLLPLASVEEILKVLMYGADLYGRENWKEVENAEQRYWNAAMRHLTQFRKGELLDPDTGLNHLAHAGCNILFLLEIVSDQETS